MTKLLLLTPGVVYPYCMPAKEGVETVTFTNNGQIVIPRRLRCQFEIEGGTKATVEPTPDGILIKPVTATLIRRGRGLLNNGGKSMSQEWKEHKQEERTREEK